MNYRMDRLQLPLLGQKTTNQLKDAIYESIVDEATAAEFYSRLLRDAPNELHYEFIEHARDDELEHLDFFQRLYRQLTGQTAQYSIIPVQYPNYKTGLLIALKDELHAAEFYRDMQMSTGSRLVRDTFYFAMVDELEHATMFSTLFNSL